MVEQLDEGLPVVLEHPESISAIAFNTLAQEVATRLAVMAENQEGSFTGPSISIKGDATPASKKPKSGLPIIG